MCYYPEKLGWRGWTKIWLIVVAMVIAGAIVDQVRGEEQTRVYAPDGKSVGTIVPQGEGSARYYDARGNSLGTSTTTGNTTTFYGSGGNVTGRTTTNRKVRK